MVKIIVDKNKGTTNVASKEDIEELEKCTILTLMAQCEKYNIEFDKALGVLKLFLTDTESQERLVDSFKDITNKDTDKIEEEDDDEYDIF